MSTPELELLYRNAGAGDIPTGYLPGKVLYCPDERFAGAKSRLSALVWHGKIFDPCTGTLINQWCGLQAVRARVYPGSSCLDGRPAIVMDYRGVSCVVWASVRDEMREVAPGLYLGVMFRCRGACAQFKMFFALEVQPGGGCSSSAKCY
jgi:hypothetical protein